MKDNKTMNKEDLIKLIDLIDDLIEKAKRSAENELECRPFNKDLDDPDELLLYARNNIIQKISYAIENKYNIPTLELQLAKEDASQTKEERYPLFQPMQIVIAIADRPDDGSGHVYPTYPWKAGDSLLYLGEIKQQSGHIVVVDWSGRVHWGLHDTDFRNPTEDEI